VFALSATYGKDFNATGETVMREKTELYQFQLHQDYANLSFVFLNERRQSGPPMPPCTVPSLNMRGLSTQKIAL
jgi:hypothetical protein